MEFMRHTLNNTLTSKGASALSITQKQLSYHFLIALLYCEMRMLLALPKILQLRGVN